MAGSLRRRLISSFVAFAVVLGALFSTVTLVVYHRAEDRVVRGRLEQMLSARSVEAETAAVRFVGPARDAPPPFARWLNGLAPGFHEWEDASEHETHALLIFDPVHRERRVAIYSFSESELSESRFALALVAGIAASTLAALLLARALAMRIVSPIERLTARLTATTLENAVPDEFTQAPPDDEVGLLARALRQAGDDLVASAERERRFLREASHELRTPITVIQGVADLLHESVAPEDTLTHQRLQRLDRGLRRMSSSVLSLLAMARAEHRATVADLPLFQQQVADLAEEARAMAKHEVDVRVRLDATPLSDFAASMLAVVLSNLAQNAVRHSGSKVVEIEVDGRLARVCDQGRGLPAKVLDQLRSEGPKPDVGIGLATVQRICTRFGWRLEIASSELDGTEVKVVFPDGSAALDGTSP